MAVMSVSHVDVFCINVEVETQEHFWKQKLGIIKKLFTLNINIGKKWVSQIRED